MFSRVGNPSHGHPRVLHLQPGLPRRGPSRSNLTAKTLPTPPVLPTPRSSTSSLAPRIKIDRSKSQSITTAPPIATPVHLTRSYTSSSKKVDGKGVSNLQKLNHSLRCKLVSECYLKGLSDTAYTKFIETHGEPNGSVDYSLKALDALTEHLKLPDLPSITPFWETHAIPDLAIPGIDLRYTSEATQLLAEEFAVFKERLKR